MVFFINLVVGDLYLLVVLLGRMYLFVYRGMGYFMFNLFCGIEEGGMLMFLFIFWNVGGVFVIFVFGLGIFGVNLENLLYIFFVFVCWMVFLIGIFYVYVGWFLFKVIKVEKEEWEFFGVEIVKFNKDGMFVIE